MMTMISSVVNDDDTDELKTLKIQFNDERYSLNDKRYLHVLPF